MTFPYVIEWTPKLRAELELVLLRDSFGGYVWPMPKRKPRPVPVEKQPRMKPAERMTEVEWLLDGGMTPWEVAAALGTTRTALERWAYKNGRRDIASRLNDPQEEYQIKSGRKAA